MGMRISDDSPRGGLGYLGLVTTLGALLTAVLTPPWIAVLTTVLLAALSVWFGMGLRRDFDNDEAHDLIIWTRTPTMDEDLVGWMLGKERATRFRLSTWMCIGGAVGVVIALVRLVVLR